MADSLTPTTLSTKTGISVPYASQILSGTRKPSRGMAIRIYRATGEKFPPIATLTDEEIAFLERVEAA